METQAVLVAKWVHLLRNLVQTQNPFMSGTGRADMWRNELNAPFTKQTYIKNPGPGQYFSNKRKDDIKQRLL